MTMTMTTTLACRPTCHDTCITYFGFVSSVDLRHKSVDFYRQLLLFLVSSAHMQQHHVVIK